MIRSNISNRKQSPYFNKTAPKKNYNTNLILAQKDWNNFTSYFYDGLLYYNFSKTNYSSKIMLCKLFIRTGKNKDISLLLL